MNRIMRIHRYLSCLVAPAMLFFSVSGAWQAFRLHESKKDGSYTAPVVLEQLTEIHKAEHLSRAAANWFRGGQVLLASIFAATAILGLVMAFRVTRPRWLFWACVAAGVVLPAFLALGARAG